MCKWVAGKTLRPGVSSSIELEPAKCRVAEDLSVSLITLKSHVISYLGIIKWSRRRTTDSHVFHPHQNASPMPPNYPPDTGPEHELDTTSFTKFGAFVRLAVRLSESARNGGLGAATLVSIFEGNNNPSLRFEIFDMLVATCLFGIGPRGKTRYMRRMIKILIENNAGDLTTFGM